MNEKLKEYLDSSNFKFKDVDENGNEIEMTLSEMLQDLIETNNRLGKELDDNYKDFKIYHEICDDYNKRVNDLQQRIDKAITYIEENSDDMHTYISQVLTSILKGSEKE